MTTILIYGLVAAMVIAGVILIDKWVSVAFYRRLRQIEAVERWYQAELDANSDLWGVRRMLFLRGLNAKRAELLAMVK